MAGKAFALSRGMRGCVPYSALRKSWLSKRTLLHFKASFASRFWPFREGNFWYTFTIKPTPSARLQNFTFLQLPFVWRPGSRLGWVASLHAWQRACALGEPTFRIPTTSTGIHFIQNGSAFLLLRTCGWRWGAPFLRSTLKYRRFPTEFTRGAHATLSWTMMMALVPVHC